MAVNVYVVVTLVVCIILAIVFAGLFAWEYTQQVEEIYDLRFQEWKHVIHTFESVTNSKLNYEIVERRAGDVPELYASTDLAKEKLGWTADKSLEEMIRSSWNWEQKLRNKTS